MNHRVSAGNQTKNPGPQEEQPALLTAELSLHHPALKSRSGLSLFLMILSLHQQTHPEILFCGTIGIPAGMWVEF